MLASGRLAHILRDQLQQDEGHRGGLDVVCKLVAYGSCTLLG